jgi:predicted dehydrogenase
MLTIGYYGNGKSTNRYHLPFVLQRPEKFRVKTIYRRNPDHDAWDKIPGVNYTSNLDDLLKDPEIDMVCVCTSSNHYECAKQVLEAGKHCLVEKPFTNTYEQAKELFDLAKSKGLLVQAYQNRRYDSDFLTVQKVIESGKLGELLEVEMHYDYYRPWVPEGNAFDKYRSYLYGHACHTIDQVLSYFGNPDSIHYDVRQLLGEGHMNDYFDLDLYYGTLKVSVKSSYFRVKERPSFVVYGKKGCFEKVTKDRQEEHLKMFYMPQGHDDFGLDLPQHYGTLTYYDDDNVYHEEKVPSEKGDYARVYDGIYDAIVNGAEKVIKDEQTLMQMKILETGISGLK